MPRPLNLEVVPAEHVHADDCVEPVIVGDVDNLDRLFKGIVCAGRFLRPKDSIRVAPG
jgi:hypothetical protein